LESYPGVPAYQESLAVTRYEQAMLFRESGRRNEGDVPLRDAVGGFVKLVSTYPATPRYREQLALYATDLAVLLAESNAMSEAEANYATSLENARWLAAAHPDEIDYAKSLAWKLVATPFAAQRNVDEGLVVARRVLALAPEDPNGWKTLALALYRNDEFEEAAQSLSRAVHLRGEPAAADAVVYALVYSKKGDLPAAREWHEKADTLLQNRVASNRELIFLKAEANAELAASESASASASPRSE
jgi:cytochrome c-type biogenesis protein CcmH/NrfG